VGVATGVAFAGPVPVHPAMNIIAMQREMTKIPALFCMLLQLHFLNLNHFVYSAASMKTGLSSGLCTGIDDWLR
jgi:hypothetical protein